MGGCNWWVAALPAAAMLLTGCSGQAVINTLTPTWGYRLHADIAYGEQPRQKLDVYVPDDAVAGAPVVVFFYGGRWSEGQKEHYKFVGEALTSRGYITAIPDYRLYPQVTFPAFVEDGARAIAWMHAHISEYGGDPNKLFVMGHSAGAHIAAMLATDARYLAAVGGGPAWLAGMIGLAGPYDFLPITAADLKIIFGPKSAWPASQPVHFVDGDEPPMLLLHGKADTTVSPKNSIALARAVEQTGGRAKLILYPGVGHIRLIATMAFLLRWLAPPQLDDLDAFVQAIVTAPAGSQATSPVQ
ncbi:MAG: alpha/beta hydrolase [Salinisphaera sp.]|nr:alpha/beta hydrolase [Salinisphaera sp.]